MSRPAQRVHPKRNADSEPRPKLLESLLDSVPIGPDALLLSSQLPELCEDAISIGPDEL
jgi:hypothetical protein